MPVAPERRRKHQICTSYNIWGGWNNKQITQEMEVCLQSPGRLEQQLLSVLDGRLGLQVMLEPAGILVLGQNLTHRRTR